MVSPRFWTLLLSVVCVGSLLASAGEARAEVPVPEPLQPWVEWVLYDEGDLDCPQLGSSRACVWPGVLEVFAEDEGATFAMDVWVARRGDVRLPGSRDLWPQDVQVNGVAAVLKAAGDTPAVALDAGRHRVTGRLVWNSPPQFVTTPPQTGRVLLELRGQPVERPRHDASGRLWIDGEEGAADGEETDRLRASVYRRIRDGVPLRVETWVDVNVSGQAREIDLGPVVLAGSRPVRLESPVPAALDGEGRLTVYARPGTHRVSLESVVAEDVESLGVPQGLPDFYDPQEVWVWVADETARTAEVRGLRAVDPSRTSLPQEWHGHTTFQAVAGEALRLETTRRGIRPGPNQLQLRRQMWLDLDGGGFTIRDSLTGEMRQGWRLNYVGPEVLGRVLEQSGDEDLLITEDPETGVSGVELRFPTTRLQADLRRTDGARSFPAVGWDHDVQQLSTTVHVPPGWSVLHVSGVDSLSGSARAVSTWTLWDFFLLLMVALAVGKLFGWKWAPLAAVALVLGHGQQGAPMWTWIHLIASLALLRALPDGFWRKTVHVYRMIVLVVLFVMMAFFIHDQVHSAVHPQVEIHRASADDLFLPVYQESAPAAPSEMVMEEMDDVSSLRAREARVYAEPASLDRAGRQVAYKQLSQVDPNAVVQTGPGVPSWTWRSVHLGWSGPVHRDQEVTMVLISPWMQKLIIALRLAALIALALLLFAPREMSWRKREEGEPARAKTPRLLRHLLKGSVVLLCMGGVSIASTTAAADEMASRASPPSAASPDGNVLNKLRQRLVAARACDGPCVVVSRADLRVEGLEFTMEAEVHAQEDTGWYLPGPADPLQLESVRVGGVETRELRREPGGLTAVRLPPGRHIVEVTGRLANRTTATLRFDDSARPRRVTFESDQWVVDGLSSAGVPDSSLQLARRDSEESETLDTARELPPWYEVERTFALGLPWQVQTRIRRVDADRSELVRLPLLEGESVLTDGPRVEGGRVLVDFPRGQTEVEYLSEIPIQEEVRLVAPTDQPWSEIWEVECSRIWRCQFSDLSPVALISDDPRVHRPRWLPWPGEELVVTVARPDGVEGQSSTIDSVTYRVQPGQRLLIATLDLTIRASEGGTRQVRIPAEAEVQETTINNTEHSLRHEDGVMDLPYQPGVQRYRIRWQQVWEPSVVQAMPEVVLDSEAVNVTLEIEQSRDRWLLHVMGPSWGPAILFWPKLIILLILALLFGQLKGIPLRTPEWMLLLIGFSQLPYGALVPVVAWFAVLTIRQRAPLTESPAKFNAFQLFIVFHTLVAAAIFYAAIHTNLLFDVNMQVEGARSSNSLLRWTLDRTDGEIGGAAVVSVPLFLWRVLMLAWACWVVSRLLAWVPWGWRAFSAGGLWQKSEKAEGSGPERSRGRYANVPRQKLGVRQPSPASAPEAADGSVEPPAPEVSEETEEKVEEPEEKADSGEDPEEEKKDE